ncbi:MAG: DNA translocase FtsK [Mycoplasma sp.]|nr:DNA translocase FtsK [Mycoplasma sp.]
MKTNFKTELIDISSDDYDNKKYNIFEDKKTLGIIILSVSILFQVFAFVRVPFLTTIHSYTIGMLFGVFNPLFYLYCAYIGLTMIFSGVRNIIPNWLKLTRWSYIFVSISLIYTIVTWFHYSSVQGTFAIGTKPWGSFNDWFKTFEKEPAYPANVWGGIVGAFMYSFTSMFLSSFGSGILASVLFAASISLFVTGTFSGFYKQLLNKQWRASHFSKDALKKKENKNDSIVSKDSPFINIIEDLNSRTEEIPIQKEVKPKNKMHENLSMQIANKKKKYELPKSLLKTPTVSKGKEEMKKFILVCSNKINQLFDKFNIDAKVQSTIIGPTLSKFIIKAAIDIDLKKIARLEGNLKMILEVSSIRLELPIPGKSALGIEIPNKKPEAVPFKDVYSELLNSKKAGPLSVALGKNIDGKLLTFEVNKTPHLLVAGATGSGKSVGINSIITSIIMKTSPANVQFILIDPKMVEFTPYEKIPHLYRPIISDPIDASAALNDMVELMEIRYKTMAENKVRKIEEWNEKCLAVGKRHLIWPYMIVIIDELADLMNVAKKEVEVSIQRITQKARAAGIHLIIATQRPSTDVVTGVIKANVPSRISFAVSSAIDSKVILDSVGAEKLLGKGDMLVSLYGEHISRAQCAFLSNEEIEKVTMHLSKVAKKNKSI